jgi:chromosome partitioning protein
MPVIVVANPKGGVGKSTLATNIAGCLAAAGHRVMLGDVDRQQSARQWLALRPAGCRPSAAGTWRR